MIPSREWREERTPPRSPASVARAMAATAGLGWLEGWRPHSEASDQQGGADEVAGAEAHGEAQSEVQAGDQARPGAGPRQDRRRPSRRRPRQPRSGGRRRREKETELQLQLLMSLSPPVCPSLLQWRPCLCMDYYLGASSYSTSYQRDLHPGLLDSQAAGRVLAVQDISASPNNNRREEREEETTATSSTEDTEEEQPGYRRPPTSPSYPGGSRAGPALRGSGASSTSTST